MTRSAVRELYTSTAKPSLLKSSMTLKFLKLRPSDSCSCIKSTDHISFITSGTCQGRKCFSLEPPLELNTQFQRELTVILVNPFMTPAKAFHIAQIKEAQLEAHIFSFAVSATSHCAISAFSWGSFG